MRHKDCVGGGGNGGGRIDLKITMSTHATISVAISGKAGGVKVAGRANVACSVAFKNVLKHLNEESVERIFIFLQECLLMDSTFLGVLAKQGVDRRIGDRRRFKIVLVAPMERVLASIENLGVLGEFEVIKTAPAVQFSFRDVSLDNVCDLRELTRTSLEAHEALVDISEENRGRFEGVVNLLSKNLRKESRS